jgi:D-beta-D-heptose 7-phosphate kinase/D-beta-D-heptose 1-phosphate adenosyltransferase
MHTDDLIDVLEGLGSPRLLVVGDLFLERILGGKARRVRTTPKTVPLTPHANGPQPGGAAAVAVLAAAFGCQVRLAGVVGDGDDGRDLLDLLARAGVGLDDVVIDRRHPTTSHDGYLTDGNGHCPPKLLQVEHRCGQFVSRDVQEGLLRRMRAAITESEAVLVVDLPQAPWGAKLLKAVFATAAVHAVPILARPARHADYGAYRGAALLALDRADAEEAIGLEIVTAADALAAGRRLVRCCAAEAVIVDRGRSGLVLSETRSCGRLLPAWPGAICDTTAVSDMLLAVLGTSRAEGMAWETAARLAAVAAGLEAARFGVSPVTRADVWVALGGVGRRNTAKVLSVEQAVRLLQQYRLSGRRVVLACGTFDLLSASHLRLLQEASQQGDFLVVAVYSDRSVRRLHRPGRPVVPEHHRVALVAALESVNHVVLLDAAPLPVVLRQLRPDVLVEEGATAPQEVWGHKIVEAYGGRVHIITCPCLSPTVQLATLRTGTYGQGG